MGDIYNTKKRLKSIVSDIKQADYISPHNTEQILKFKNHLLAEGLSRHRTIRHLSSLKTLGKSIKFPLDQAEKHQIKEITAKINQSEINEKDYAPYTKNEFRKTLKKYYQYLTGEKKPEIVDFLRTSLKTNEEKEIDINTLPTPETVKKLLTACNNKRDEALLFTLWDLGARIGELLEIKWKDIQFGNELTTITVNGKTGERHVSVYECVETLKEWQDEHIAGDNPEAYVFSKTNSKEQLTSSAWHSQIRRIRKRTDISDQVKVNPQKFRSGRATYLAKQGFNAVELMAYFGWKKFETARYYIKVAAQDLENRVKTMHGLEENKKEEQTDLRPIKCPHCQTINPASRDYCKNCNELISRTKELFREVKKDEILSETKDELMGELLERKGQISKDDFQEIAHQKLEEKIEQRMGF